MNTLDIDTLKESIEKCLPSILDAVPVSKQATIDSLIKLIITSQFTAGNAVLRSDLPEEDEWYFCVCDDVYKEVLWHHGNNVWRNQQEQKVNYKSIKWLDYEKD